MPHHRSTASHAVAGRRLATHVVWVALALLSVAALSEQAAGDSSLYRELRADAVAHSSTATRAQAPAADHALGPTAATRSAIASSGSSSFDGEPIMTRPPPTRQDARLTIEKTRAPASSTTTPKPTKSTPVTTESRVSIAPIALVTATPTFVEQTTRKPAKPATSTTTPETEPPMSITPIAPATPQNEENVVTQPPSTGSGHTPKPTATAHPAISDDDSEDHDFSTRAPVATTPAASTDDATPVPTPSSTPRDRPLPAKTPKPSISKTPKPPAVRTPQPTPVDSGSDADETSPSGAGGVVPAASATPRVPVVTPTTMKPDGSIDVPVVVVQTRRPTAAPVTKPPTASDGNATTVVPTATPTPDTLTPPAAALPSPSPSPSKSVAPTDAASAAPTPTTKRPSGIENGWNLIKDFITGNRTRTPRPETPSATTPTPTVDDVPGKVVAPDLAADKVVPTSNSSSSRPTDAPAAASTTSPTPATNGFNLIRPGRDNATAADDAGTPSTATPTQTPKAKIDVKKANKTVTVLDDPDAVDDVKAKAFKVEDATTSTTITLTNGNKTQTFHKYDRNTKTEAKGKRDKTGAATTGATGATNNAAPAESTGDDGGASYSNIIGGSNRAHPPPGADIEVSALAAQTQNAIRYSSYAFAVTSCALLLLFHVLALASPTWLFATASARRTDASWLRPTTWELVAVVTYYQHVGAVSMLELTKAPYLLLDFTDSFSWANLHVHAIVTTTTRRLQFVILTGIVSYSDRLGMDEGSILATTTRVVLVLAAIVLALFAVAVAASRCTTSKANASSSSTDAPVSQHSIALCVAGLGVALWLIGIFPLVTVSVYELAMQIKYQVSGELAVAMANIALGVVAALCYVFYRVRSIRAADAFTPHNHAVFGTLYADAKQRFRYFFVALVLFQAVTGVLTGGVQDVPDQLVALLIVHVLFCATVVYLAPFADRRVFAVVVTLFVVRLVNLALAFAFLTGNELATSTRATVAHAFVFVNFAVVLLLFARHVLVFAATLRLWSQAGGDNSLDSSAYQQNASMLAVDVHDELRDDARLTATMSVVRGPNNSMHC